GGHVAQEYLAVDLRRVGLAAGGGAHVAVLVRLADFVDDHRQGAADLGGELVGADPLGQLHKAGVALFLDRLGHWVGQQVGRGALDRPERKAPTRSSCASSSQPRRYSKSSSVSPGKPTTKLERTVISGQIRRQLASRSSTFASFAGRFIALRTCGLACWKGMSR